MRQVTLDHGPQVVREQEKDKQVDHAPQINFIRTQHGVFVGVVRLNCQGQTQVL